MGIFIFGILVWWLVSPLLIEGEKREEDLSDLLNLDVDEILFIGNFVKMDNVHKGSGLINIVKQENGDINLLFINVDIADGPGLVVYLSSKASFDRITDDPGNYVDLGDLPANRGNFSISMPSNLTIEPMNSILIWCEPFKVVFTFASLQNA